MNVNHQDIADTLDLALEIIGEDLHTLYKRADDPIRRLINQAIFKALYINDDEVTHAELAEPFTQLRALHNAIHDDGVVDTATIYETLTGDETTEGPHPNRGLEPLAIGSISDYMVGETSLCANHALMAGPTVGIG